MPMLRAPRPFRTSHRRVLDVADWDDTAVRSWLPTIGLALCALALAILSGCDAGPDPFDDPLQFLADRGENAYNFDEHWDEDIWQDGALLTATMAVTGTYQPEPGLEGGNCNACGVYTVRIEIKRVYSPEGEVARGAGGQYSVPEILAQYRYRVTQEAVPPPPGETYGTTYRHVVTYLDPHRPEEFDGRLRRQGGGQKLILQANHFAMGGKSQIVLRPGTEVRGPAPAGGYPLSGIGTFERWNEAL